MWTIKMLQLANYHISDNRLLILMNLQNQSCISDRNVNNRNSISMITRNKMRWKISEAITLIIFDQINVGVWLRLFLYRLLRYMNYCLVAIYISMKFKICNTGCYIYILLCIVHNWNVSNIFANYFNLNNAKFFATFIIFQIY